MHSHQAALVERANIVFAFAPAVPSSASPKWVSMKYYNRVAIIIEVSNASVTTAITGCAVALAQATAVAGTGTKAIAFTKMWANTDTAAQNTLTETAVTSNTFTTTTVTGKNALYIIDLKANMLDVNNSFDCFQVTLGNAVSATVSATYIMEGARLPNAPTLSSPEAD